MQLEAPPIRQDADGSLRVGQSRVLVELVIQEFQRGATPEQIAQRYETATLPDVYGVIAYYLRHREEIEAYLAERERAGQLVRAKIESRQGDLGDIRDRLMARQAKQD